MENVAGGILIFSTCFITFLRELSNQKGHKKLAYQKWIRKQAFGSRCTDRLYRRFRLSAMQANNFMKSRLADGLAARGL